MTPPSVNGAAKHGRLHWIDALRGIAALAVMFSHYIWTPLAEEQGIWHYLISPGEFGVATFFCVSGFIIPFSVKNIHGSGTIGFIINRIFRLYPLYWLCLIFAISLTPVALSQALINGTMLQRFVGVPDVVPVFWTLQVEVVFYVFIAAFVWLSIGNRNKAFLYSGYFALAAVLACALTRHVLDRKAPVGLFAGLTVMFFVAAYYENIRVPKISPRTLRLSVAAAVIVLPAAWLIAYDRNWGSNEVPFWSALTMVVSYGLAVLTFVSATKVSDHFPQWLIYIGKISYPLYLLHDPLHKLLDRMIGETVGFWPTSIIAAIATCVAAAALHQWLELPLIAIGRRASSRWRQNPQLAAQTAQAPA